VTFKYDPLGWRIQKSSASGTTNYLYDATNMIEEIDATGTLLARYAQGTGIDEPMAQIRSGTVGFYEQDGLGSVNTLSDATGLIGNSYTYGSFGNLTSSTGSFANPFQYTGRDFDSETGLRYHRARYYDSTTGRFLSEDPLGFNEGVNFYSYVANSPVGFTDPTGLALTPDACKRILARINLNAEILEGKISKYDPVIDGQGGSPYRGRGGHLGNTRPEEHYWKILDLQAKIWLDVALYQRECKDGPKCPQKVYEMGNKKIPEPVKPPATHPLTDLYWKYYPFTGPFWDSVREWQNEMERAIMRGPQPMPGPAPVPGSGSIPWWEW
jgi:RHS repeat-associated protein